MRIRSLHLQRFGGFTDHRLEFGIDTGKLHLVYGANESGKSTTLRAIGDLLFGFGQRTPDDYLHDKKALRVGAVLAGDDGRDLELYRRKGTKKTLLGPDGKELDDDLLAPLLGAVDRAAFERLFGLDHAWLRRGGEELLRGGGNVALGLFQAAAGVASVREVQGSLAAEADELFRPRGSTQTINATLRQLQEVRTRVRQAAVSAEGYHKLEQELAEVEALLGAHQQGVRELEARRRQCERTRRALAPVAQRQALLAEAEALAAVPLLSNDAARQREAAEELLHRASAKLEASSARELALRRKRDAKAISKEVLDAEGRLRRLPDLYAKWAGAVDDLPRREAEEVAARRAVEGLLRAARLDVPVVEAAQAIPPSSQVQLIRRVADQRDVLDERLSLLRGRLDELATERGRKARQLEELPEVIGPEALERTLDDVRSAGLAERALERLERAAAREGEELGQALAALPLFQGNTHDLRGLRVPVDGTVERYAKSWHEETSALEAARRRLDEARQATEQQRHEVHSIQDQGELPTQGAVEAARARRDDGWRIVRRWHIDPVHGGQADPSHHGEDLAAVAREFDPGRSLPEAYEAAVIHADKLGDRRQAETARVARFEHACERLAAQEAHEAACAERLHGAEAAVAELHRRWTAEWTGLGAPPLPPAEMKEWLRARREVLTRAERLEHARAAEHDEFAKLDESRQRLTRALERYGVSVAEGISLAELLDLGDAKARELRDGIERVKNVKDALERLDREWEATRTKLGQTERDLVAWSEKWEVALGDLAGRNVGHPLEVRRLLDVLDELRVEVTRWRDLDRRVRAMRADRDALGAAVHELVVALAPELSGRPLLEAAESLMALFEETKQSVRFRDTIGVELDEAEVAKRDAVLEIEAARATLRRLCEQAGCQAPDELRIIEDKARRKLQVEQDLRSIEHQLLAGGDGLSLDELVRESQAVDAETLRVESERLEALIDGERERLDPLVERRTRVRQALGAMTGSDEAAEGAQCAEGLAVGLRDAAEQWLVLKLASELLQRGLQRYRERNQGPLMGRAADVFCDLTLGRYPKLAVDYDAQDRPVLQGVLMDGRQVGVESMSDGTRDQLYLALRLAVIEQLSQKGETVPATFDDLLVHCDDERSAAALRALGGLADHLQVIYFTHHQTIVDLARRLLPPERLVVHTLPS